MAEVISLFVGHWPRRRAGMSPGFGVHYLDWLAPFCFVLRRSLDRPRLFFPRDFLCSWSMLIAELSLVLREFDPGWTVACRSGSFQVSRLVHYRAYRVRIPRAVMAEQSGRPNRPRVSRSYWLTAL
jgi:hypothetical protein